VWSYSAVLTQPVDIVRYLVGDTDTTEQLVQDEEITYALTANPNVRMAAAEIALRIAIKFTREVTTRVGDTQVNWSDRAQQYSLLARQLRLEAALRGAIPYAGGIDAGDKATQAADPGLVQPAFTRALFDRPTVDESQL